MIFKNVTYYNDAFEKETADIEIENSFIKNIGTLDAAGRDMSDYILIPGFIDIHIHGRSGGDFSDAKTDSIEKISSSLAKSGITSFCGTTMTLPFEDLTKIIETGKNYMGHETGAKLVGINLEGPFIAMEKKGAQNGDYVRKGTINEFNALNSIGRNIIKIITIAPEAFESDTFISHVSKHCTVSVGHTLATENEANAAFSAGAKLTTHLYNAMPPVSHRNPGTAGAALDNKNIFCELICDGHHVYPTVLRNTFKILGENRACVISDSMRGAGLGEGTYELGGQEVFVKENGEYAQLKDGTFAASICSVYEGFKNLLRFEIDMKTALKSCTINPAKAIGLDKEIGSIAVGKKADLVFLDNKMNIQEVYINGVRA